MVSQLERYFTRLKTRVTDIARPLMDRFVTLEAGLDFARVKRLVSSYKTRRFRRSMPALTRGVHLTRRVAKATNILSLLPSYSSSS